MVNWEGEKAIWERSLVDGREELQVCMYVCIAHCRVRGVWSVCVRVCRCVWVLDKWLSFEGSVIHMRRILILTEAPNAPAASAEECG